MLKLLGSTEKKLRKIKITIKIVNVNQNKKCFSFRNQWTRINSSQYCQQWLSTQFKSLVYICSNQIIRSIIRYFAEKIYISKNIWFRVFLNWSMVYWSKY